MLSGNQEIFFAAPGEFDGVWKMVSSPFGSASGPSYNEKLLEVGDIFNLFIYFRSSEGSPDWSPRVQHGTPSKGASRLLHHTQPRYPAIALTSIS